MWPSVSFAGLEEDLLFGDNQGIFVASQQYEPLTEAPVVFNVITAEEIRRMGARTLNDVLLTLPGFSDHRRRLDRRRDELPIAVRAKHRERAPADEAYLCSLVGSGVGRR
jgi:outer membrane receptor for ferrienterochelin and colicin